MLFSLGGLLVRVVPLVESAALSPQLIITQVKITSSNGQFITIYNNSANTLDLSTVLLQYYNNYDLLKATSGKLISLSGKVPAHSYFVVNDGPLQACYQMVVDSVSLGLSSTAGMVQISHFSSTSSPQSLGILDDYVGWSKTAAVGAQTLPTSTSTYLQRQPLDSQNVPIVSAPGGGSWISAQQPDGSTLCSFSSANVATGVQLLSSNSSPPSVVLSSSASSGDGMPAADAGLIAPQLSEVLPNPASPQSDATDEFIELYNPNNAAFDLSGFMLRTGISTFHNFIFPAGQFILQPHEFRAFYAPQTGITLTNDNGQAALLDPSSNVLAISDIYDTAKDGYAWVYAQGLWQWTTTATPNAANVITAPPTAASKAAAAASVKAAKTGTGTKASTKSAKTAKASTAKATSNFASTPASKISNLHPLVLAGIGTAALIYACYEYRHDLANNFYRFRRYRTARRTSGASIKAASGY
jgi:Lamin Tail Domain